MNTPQESKSLVCMVALNEEALPSASEIQVALAARLPGASESEITEDDGTFTIELGKNRGIVSTIPAPIPWSELAGPCETAWWWPEATEQLKPHVAHAIIALFGDAGTALQRHIQLTHLASAVASTANAAGIYWGGGTIVHEPAAFEELSADLGDQIEPQLWIDMRLGQNDDGSFSYFTTGMEAFGHLEVEIDSVPLQSQELFDFAYSIIHYILTSGATIADGETIGRTEDEKVRITHEESTWDRKGDVMKLTFS
jgi:hypothetical protein